MMLLLIPEQKRNSMYLPFFPRKDDNLQIHEISSLSLQTIITLAEVLKVHDSLLLSKFYKKVILIIQRSIDDIEIGIVVIKPTGDMVWHPLKSINRKECPSQFISKLEGAKSRNSVVDGYPAVVIEIPKNVRDYILNRANGNDV